jgi:hypothetical protein
MTSAMFRVNRRTGKASNAKPAASMSAADIQKYIEGQGVTLKELIHEWNEYRKDNRHADAEALLRSTILNRLPAQIDRDSSQDMKSVRLALSRCTY